MANRSVRAKARWTLPRLGAGGPDPELAKQLETFGQFVGDWRIVDCRVRGADGRWSHLEGELHWRWILEGRAVQDVWTLREPGSGRLVYEGTTIRIYNPMTDLWSSMWISATHRRVRAFVGHPEEGRILLDEQVPPGAVSERWVFSRIRPNAFSWHAEEDRHDGAGWVRTEVMDIRRERVPTRS